MNSKKCKELRSMLRRLGIEPTQAVYKGRKIVNKTFNTVSTQIVLDRECGRGKYQRFKKRRISYWRTAHA